MSDRASDFANQSNEKENIDVIADQIEDVNEQNQVFEKEESTEQTHPILDKEKQYPVINVVDVDKEENDIVDNIQF
jgi:hypothetical protein